MFQNFDSRKVYMYMFFYKRKTNRLQRTNSVVIRVTIAKKNDNNIIIVFLSKILKHKIRYLTYIVLSLKYLLFHSSLFLLQKV